VSVTAEDSRILSRAAAPDDAPFERALRPRSGKSLLLTATRLAAF